MIHVYRLECVFFFQRRHHLAATTQPLRVMRAFTELPKTRCVRVTLRLFLCSVADAGRHNGRAGCGSCPSEDRAEPRML